MPPALTTRRAVELARVGTWSASTGTWECTREQLADAVRAAQDPTFRAPILKLGHTDPRFNGDGQPAVGTVTNLRLADDGDVLIGDLEGVPAWLNDVMPSAYPSRSVEMALDVVTASGEKYAGVLTGLALLGVVAPAIESLASVASLYEVAAAGPQWTAGRAVAAAMPGQPFPAEPAQSPPSGGTVPDLDTITAAFTAWAATGDDTVPADATLTEVWPDHVIAADPSGRLYRVTYATADTDGTAPAFTAPQRVTRTYVPVADTVTARAAHAAHRPLLWSRGRADVSASKPEETPAVSEIPAFAQAVRDALGLGADVDDKAVLSALAEKTKAPTTPADTTPATPAADSGKPADAPATSPAESVQTPEGLEALVAARVAAANAPVLAQLKTVSEELAARKAAEQVTRRETILASALQSGKITPAARDKWAAQYDAAPSVVENLLDAIAPGTAMPVMASGHVGAEPTNTDADSALYTSLYGSPKEA